jgi:tripartite ATP-independent transporter DctP family solute receptor
MTLTRRNFLQAIPAASIGAAALGTGLMPRAAKAAPITLRFGCVPATTHPLAIRASEAAQRIREESNGEIDIKVFPNNQLGSDADTLSQVRLGAVDFMSLSALVLANYVPTASITGVGFAWPDYAAVWKALDGDLGAHVASEINKKGLTVVGRVWDFGFRQTTSSDRKILSAADLKGFKIRVPTGNMFVSLFQALGASPTAINWTETYSALQTKLVDGQENPLGPVLFSKIFEVQKYVSMTNHMWDGNWTIFNAKKFAALPADARALIIKHFDRSGMDERSDIAGQDAKIKLQLEQDKLTFQNPDLESFKAQLKSAGYYTSMKAKYDPATWALLEKYTGKLA